MLNLSIDRFVKKINALEEKTATEGVADAIQIKSLSAQLWQQLKYKESLLAQESQVKWIAEGNVNTRYFHMCLNNNRRRNQIVKLKCGDKWVEDVSRIMLLTKEFFENRFRDENMSRPAGQKSFILKNNKKLH